MCHDGSSEVASVGGKLDDGMKRLKIMVAKFAGLPAFRKALIGGGIAGAGLLFLVLLFLVADRMAPMDLTPRTRTRVVLADDGTPLRAFPDEKGIWRYPVTPDQVSPLYLQALLGYEDRWFYRHPGVNPLSLLRAGWQWARNGRVISGGSTLTMQVARLRRPVPRTAPGKLRQIFHALQLELHFTKEEILTYYLNHAPFGGTFEGVQAASYAYFDHGAAELTHAQAALLAVMPQAPSRLPERDALRPRGHGHRAPLPGSTLQPFIYGMALDQGLIYSQSLLMDVPIQFNDYRPVNFHRAFSGPVSGHGNSLGGDMVPQAMACILGQRDGSLDSGVDS